jgi:hypothetical protein
MDRKTYAFTIDGRVFAGTLEDYASAYENAYLAEEVLGFVLWDGATARKARVEQHAVKEDGGMPFTVSVGNDKAGGVVYEPFYPADAVAWLL